eukprot:351471-Chlamydomonas_euryale.AAC.3
MRRARNTNAWSWDCTHEQWRAVDTRKLAKSAGSRCVTQKCVSGASALSLASTTSAFSATICAGAGAKLWARWRQRMSLRWAGRKCLWASAWAWSRAEADGRAEFGWVWSPKGTGGGKERERTDKVT